jgi:hypothetical protein
MAATDSLERNIGYYKDGKFTIKHFDFPASMDSHEKLLSYLGLKEINDREFPPHGLEVYYGNYSKETESFQYGVIITFWDDHGPLVICDTYMDFLKLLNDLHGYMTLVKNASIFNIEMNTKDISKSIEELSGKIDEIDSKLIDVVQETRTVGNLVEVGIGRILKGYIENGVEKITSVIRQMKC